MTTRTVWLLLLSLTASVGASAAAPAVPAALAVPGEIALRQAILDRARALVVARDFAGLNALERDYRVNRARTPSGSSKLNLYHAGVQGSLPQPNPADGCRNDAARFIDAWAKRDPNAPAPPITQAYFQMRVAWCHRGSDYAGSVAEDAWAPFHAQAAAAAKTLADHPQAAADPQYYAELADIYLAQGRDEAAMQALLDRASARHSYYYAIYWAASTYYLPQWFGSPERFDRLARYTAERTRADEGGGGYARFYWHAIAVDCGCWREAIDRPTMKRAMRDVAKRYPDPWNIASFARIACILEDPAEAQHYFAALSAADDGREPWDKDIDGWQRCRAAAALSAKGGG
ncbi:MAG: hypothetical protein ABIW16_00395 [Sphingomicrobium sp.]